MSEQHFKWRIVSDASPWKQSKGRVLAFEMTEEHARQWQVSNPGTVIEKVEGSGYVRQGHGVTSELRK